MFNINLAILASCRHIFAYICNFTFSTLQARRTSKDRSVQPSFECNSCKSYVWNGQQLPAFLAQHDSPKLIILVAHSCRRRCLVCSAIST